MKKKVFTEDVPDKGKSKEREKLERSIKEILQQYESTEKTKTDLAYKLGVKFDKLKALLKEEGVGFKKHMKKTFPYITLRTVERHIELSKKVDLKSQPKLAVAGETRLLRLAKLAGEDDLQDFLTKNKIDLEIDTDDPQEVKAVRKGMDDLLRKARKEESSQSINAVLAKLSKSTSWYLTTIESLTSDEEVAKNAKKSNIMQALQTINKIRQVLRGIRGKAKERK